MATYADYIKMSREQLIKELNSTKKALFDIQYQVRNKQSKANHEITTYKVAVARLMTALKNTNETTKALESEDETVQNGAAKKEKAVKAPRKAKAKQE